MTSRIDRTRRLAAARRGAQAAPSEPDAAFEARPGLPALLAPGAEPPAPPARCGESAFAAQMLGQDGQKRGLRAGPPLLEAARRTYAAIEWSGASDRRARKGRRARTEI